MTTGICGGRPGAVLPPGTRRRTIQIVGGASEGGSHAVKNAVACGVRGWNRPPRRWAGCHCQRLHQRSGSRRGRGTRCRPSCRVGCRGRMCCRPSHGEKEAAGAATATIAATTATTATAGAAKAAAGASASTGRVGLTRGAQAPARAVAGPARISEARPGQRGGQRALNSRWGCRVSASLLDVSCAA
jgi:hypothetical protein